MLTAARLRERFGVPGMTVDTVRGFRDKQLMKERVAAAGLRVPRSERVRTVAEARAAAERIGYPLIAQADRRRGQRRHLPGRRARAELEAALGAHAPRHRGELRGVHRRRGVHVRHRVHRRRAGVRERRAVPAASRSIARSQRVDQPGDHHGARPAQPALAAGIALGRSVLDALGMGDGFTHMEWFRKPDGEVVFGEIGCRPGGAHLVDQMNYTCDIDLFREWARAVCWGTFEAPTARKYNAAIIFKRAQGPGPDHARSTGSREFMHALRRARRRAAPAAGRHARAATGSRRWSPTATSCCATPTGTSRARWPTTRRET